MTEPIEVRCPTCNTPPGTPCNTVILGGGDYHSGRIAKSANWERSVEAARKKTKQVIPGSRKGYLKIVEPIGDSSLVESFTLAIRCPARQCKAAPGVRCDATRVEWHAQREKRGTELKTRYDNQ